MKEESEICSERSNAVKNKNNNDLCSGQMWETFGL